MRKLLAMGLCFAAGAHAANHLVIVSPVTAQLVMAGSGGFGVTVRVLDENSIPVGGQHVLFTVPGGCATFSGLIWEDVISGVDGTASTQPFAAGSQAGTCAVNASLASAGSIQIPYEIYLVSELVVTQLPSASISTAADGSFELSVNLQLRGAPLVNWPVSWFAVAFAGEASAAVDALVSTDSNGTSTSRATANGMAGSYAIVANYGGPFQRFDVTQGVSSNPALQHASVASPLGSGTISVSLLPGQSGCELSKVLAFDVHASSISVPANYGFPFGALALRASNCRAGQGADFVITYPQPLPAKATFWQWGGASGEISHWYQVSATISGSQATLHFFDGGPNDDAVAAGTFQISTGGIMVPGGLFQDMWWSGLAENGWGMSLVQHNDTLFGALYIYDMNGKPIWVVMPRGDWDSTHKTYGGAVYKPIGTPFYAYNSQNLYVGAPVGSVSITFQDANNAILDYTLAGVTGRKLVTREIFATGAAPPLDRSDLWWGGIGQNGWGVTVLQQASTLFSVWYTYDANEDPFWYVMPGGTWTASDTYEGHVYRTTGSPWVGAQYDPAKLQVFDVGTYRIQFNGDAASFGYTIDGHTGTIPLVREPF